MTNRTLHLDRYAPCPCGSGRKAKFCCNTVSGRWDKKPAIISPPAPLTKKTVAGCYLSPTKDCGGKLSREHYISHGILRQMTLSGKSAVSGLPWINDKQFTRFPSGSLTAKVLSKRHNEALSPLDARRGAEMAQETTQASKSFNFTLSSFAERRRTWSPIRSSVINGKKIGLQPRRCVAMSLA